MADISIETTLQRVQNAKLSRDFSMATRLLRQALENHPDSVELWSELGNCYVKNGEDRRAIDSFENVLKIEGANVLALNELGGIYRRLGEYDKSVAVLEKGLMTAQDTLQINYNLGYTYKLAGRYDAAETCFNEVLERNPNDVLAINHIGNIQALRGNHVRALQSYWRALQIDPNHPILHLNSARSYVALGKEAEAKNSFENALKSKPGWEDAMNGYAELLMKGKDLTKSESVLDQAIKINPNSPELHNTKGHLSVKQGRYNVAEDSYETALEIDQENMNALNGLELLYEKQGRNVEALKKIKRMEELDPENLEYDLRYIKLLIDQKRLEDAGEKLKKLYQENLDNTAYLNLLSQYFIRSGHIDKANGCFKRISELEPSNINYMRDAAWQYFLNKEYDTAAEHLDHYLEKFPKDSLALRLRGDICEKMNDSEKALEYWKKALEHDENNPLILASVQRVGEQNQDKASVTALVTDILSNSAVTGDADSIKRSLDLYENSVQNLQSDDAVVAPPVPEELGAEIESLETIDYEQLLQFEPEPDAEVSDPFDSLMIDVHPEDYLRPIDEEMYSKNMQRENNDFGLIDDDMPTEYIPSRDGNLDTDPYAAGSSQQYGVDEDDSILDVTGTPFEEEFIGEEPESTEYRAVGEPEKTPVVQQPSYTAAPATPVEVPPEPAPAYAEAPAQPETSVQPEYPADPVEDPEPAPEPTVEPDDLFPGDRDTSEDEIPTVNDLIADPVEEDELHELSEVPTIQDLIGDVEESEPDEEPVTDEPVIEDPVIEDQVIEEPVSDEPVIDESDVQEPVIEEPVSEDSVPVEPVTSEPVIEDTEPEDMPDVTHFVSDNPDPEKRTQETVGNVLQKVVFKSEERPEFESTAAMFSDLRDLTQWLPEEKTNQFMNSMNRLQLDYVIARLRGKPGLLAAATAVRETGGIIPEPRQKPSLLKTMEYIRSLTAMLPEKSQAEALEMQMNRVMGLIKEQ